MIQKETVIGAVRFDKNSRILVFCQDCFSAGYDPVLYESVHNNEITLAVAALTFKSHSETLCHTVDLIDLSQPFKQ